MSLSLPTPRGITSHLDNPPRFPPPRASHTARVSCSFLPQRVTACLKRFRGDPSFSGHEDRGPFSGLEAQHHQPCPALQARHVSGPSSLQPSSALTPPTPGPLHVPLLLCGWRCSPLCPGPPTVTSSDSLGQDEVSPFAPFINSPSRVYWTVIVALLLSAPATARAQPIHLILHNLPDN